MKRFFVLIIIITLFFVSKTMAAAEKAPAVHLTLTKAVRLAAAQNAQLSAAGQRVRQAVLDVAVSRSALMPQLSGVFGGRRQTTDLRASGIGLPGDPHVGPFNSFDTRLRLSLDLLDPSAIERLKEAKAGQRLSQAQYNKIREDVLVLTAAVFLEARRAYEALALFKVQFLEKKEGYALARLRSEQGTGSLVDLEAVKAEMEDAAYRLKNAEFKYHQTRMDLNALLGFTADQELVLEQDNAWAKQSLAQKGPSAQVIVSQEQVNLSKASVREVRSGFWPKLTASGDYGRLGGSPSDSSRTYALGLSVSMPLWEGGFRQARLQKAKAKLEEDEILLKDALDQQSISIKKAAMQVRETQALLKARSAWLTYARHQLLITQGRFQRGSASRMNVLKADSFRAQHLDAVNEAEALYWTAKIKLARIMGRLEELFDIK